MSSSVRVRRVRLEHASSERSRALPNGVTVIVGASGGGKTSLVHVIDYAPGMDAPLIDEITQVSSGVIVDMKSAVATSKARQSVHPASGDRRVRRTARG